jgi:hypothetical protein
MKKIIFLFSLTVLAFTFSSGQSEISLSNLDNENAKNWSFNSPNKADAYSWISKDGKRIYYTKDNSNEEIWMAERKSINETFQNPVAIQIEGLEGEMEIFSSWLTPDESILYFITRESDEKFNTFLYKANYNSVSKSFKDPKRINLDLGDQKNQTSIFISGPSLSSDLSELFVYFSGEDDKERIAHFEGKDGINYSFKAYLNEADNYCPGTLSEDGLSFYLTLRNESNILVKLNRSQTHSAFTKTEYFIIDTLRNHGKNYYQPHVNSDLGIISITYGTGTWQSNEIDVIEFPKTKAKDYKPVNTEEKIVINNSEENQQTFTFIPIILSDSAVQPIIIYQTDLIDSTTNQVNESSTYSEDSQLDKNTITTKFAILKNNPNIELYPNPANDKIKIKADFGANDPTSILLEIMDLNGKLIQTEQIFLLNEELSINTTNLKEGVYFCRISATGIVYKNKKIVIRRS